MTGRGSRPRTDRAVRNRPMRAANPRRVTLTLREETIQRAEKRIPGMIGQTAAALRRTAGETSRRAMEPRALALPLPDRPRSIGMRPMFMRPVALSRNPSPSVSSTNRAAAGEAGEAEAQGVAAELMIATEMCGGFLRPKMAKLPPS